MDHSEHLETYLEIVKQIYFDLKAEGKLENVLEKFESSKVTNQLG